MIEVKSSQLAGIERSFFSVVMALKKLPPKSISCQLSKIFGPLVKKNCLILHSASEDGMMRTSIFQLKIIVKSCAVFETICKARIIQSKLKYIIIDI